MTSSQQGISAALLFNASILSVYFIIREWVMHRLQSLVNMCWNGFALKSKGCSGLSFTVIGPSSSGSFAWRWVGAYTSV